MLFAVIVLVGFTPSSGERGFQRVYMDINGGLRTALGMFEVDCGRYPTAAEGLGILIKAPADGSITNWRGPYIDSPKVPEDPWGHPYVYRFPGVHNTNTFDLYSLGPDGISKSGGNDPDDIGNWGKPSFQEVSEGIPIGIAIAVLILPIPFLYLIRIAIAAFSPRFRVFVKQNRLADQIWCVMAAIALVVVWLAFTTKIAER